MPSPALKRRALRQAPQEACRAGLKHPEEPAQTMHGTRGVANDPAGLLEAWVEAFNRADLQAICALYAAEALLWGTTAQAVVAQPAGIEAYFQAVFDIEPAPQVQVTGCIARAYGEFAVLAGSYDLAFVVGGQRQVQPARFTFTVRRSGAAWLVVQHHSSKLPTEPLVPQAGSAGKA